MQRYRTAPRVEPLEDRTLMSTCHVTRLSDTGNGKGFRGDLRYCINKVNAEPGPDVIDFTVTGTINLNGALPDLASELSVQGPGAESLTVRRDTGGQYQIFSVDASATVQIADMTIRGGSAPGGRGGGIFNSGILTIERSVITKNVAATSTTGKGGGIFNDGSLTIIASSIEQNWVDVIGPSTYGGGIYNSGKLWVYDSAIVSNAAYWFGSGSGIYSEGEMVVLNSTIAGNQTDSGSAITAKGSLNVISHSTISGNVGVSSYPGGGLRADGPTFMRNTIVAGNEDWDVQGVLTSSDHNLVGDASTGSGFGPNDVLDVDPLLGPLSDNGGPTLTMALLPGSPAIDAGDNTDAPEWDQRGPGFPRIVNGTIDIGAFEVQSSPIPPVAWPSSRAGNELFALMLATAYLDELD